MGKYVLLNFPIIKIWIPVLQYIQTFLFNIDKLIAEYSEKMGGAKLPSWALRKDDPILCDKLYELFNEHIYYLLTIIHNTNYLLKTSEKQDILKAYKIISSQKIKNMKDLELQLPQPCTLTLNDIDPKNPKTILV